MNSSFQIIQFALNSAVSFVKETHPAVKLGIMITGIATTALLNYMLRPEPSKSSNKYKSFCNSVPQKLIGSEEFKKTIQNLYCLNDQYLLDTNLQLQKRPTRLSAIWNQFKMAFGCADQFEDIKAKNVIPKLKAFVEKNKDNLYCNKMNGFDVFKILDNFQTRVVRIPQEYFNKINIIKHSLNNIQPTSWNKVLLQFKGSIPSLSTSLTEEIVDACMKGDHDAFKLLVKIAENQAITVEMNKETFRNTGFSIVPLSPPIADFQTDFSLNAYIQLSMVYFKNNDVEKAKEMILLAFEKTDIKTDSASQSMAQDYYEFFGETCYSFGLEAQNKKNPYYLKFFIAAKDYILKNVPSDVKNLVSSLSNSEAKEFRQVATSYYESIISDLNSTPQIIGPDIYLSLMKLYNEEKGNLDKLIKLGQDYFYPVDLENQLEVSKLTERFDCNTDDREIDIYTIYFEAKKARAAKITSNIRRGMAAIDALYDK